MVSDNDQVSPAEKLEKMFNKYGLDLENVSKKNKDPITVEKVFRIFEGEHNSMRSQDLITEAVRWVKKICEKNYIKEYDSKSSPPKAISRSCKKRNLGDIVDAEEP